MKNVIVTGANGFIGSSLVMKLLDQGCTVTAIDISFAGDRLPDVSGLKKICTTIDDPELINMIPTGEYDAFYHLAWRGVNGPDKADPVIQLRNSEMTMCMASLAKKLGCKKFLCSGTIAEQAVNSLNHLEKVSGGMMYGTAKHCTRLMLETYCKNIGLDFVWMQFSNIYGPQNKTGNLVSYTLGQLVKGEAATFGPASQYYDFIYVDDLLEAVYRLGEYKTEKNMYFIGSGKPRLLKEYLFEIGRAFGREDLIQVGARGDDGIVYTSEMFETEELITAIGNYVSMDFEDGIRYTIEHY